MIFYSFKNPLALSALLVTVTSASVRGVDKKIKKKQHADRSLSTPHHHAQHHHSPHDFQSRIVGGVNAPSGAYKFMVSWNGECGGSLIAPDLVLTAAHCAAITGGVRIGSDLIDSGGVTRSVATKCPHPDYDDGAASTDNDYLILKLDQPVDINMYKTIKLNSDASQPQENDMLTVIGFGALSEGGAGSDRLQQVQVPANSHATCSSQYSGVKEDIHLCAGFTKGGKDSCQGDSGGPIFEIQNGAPVQVGVVSYGEGCARPNKSGVYARVSGAYDWIQSTMSNLDAGNGCSGGGSSGGGGGGGDGSGGGGSGGGGSCTDQPNWHDADGEMYDCEWYAEDNNCADFGDDFENFGSTATGACCACGGGSSGDDGSGDGTGGGDGSCSDAPSGWYDADGEEFDCTWYAEGDNCAEYGDDFENMGETANTACCACGGGATN